MDILNITIILVIIILFIIALYLFFTGSTCESTTANGQKQYYESFASDATIPTTTQYDVNAMTSDIDMIVDTALSDNLNNNITPYITNQVKLDRITNQLMNINAKLQAGLNSSKMAAANGDMIFY